MAFRPPLTHEQSVITWEKDHRLKYHPRALLQMTPSVISHIEFVRAREKHLRGSPSRLGSRSSSSPISEVSVRMEAVTVSLKWLSPSHPTGSISDPAPHSATPLTASERPLAKTVSLTFNPTSMHWSSFRSDSGIKVARWGGWTTIARR